MQSYNGVFMMTSLAMILQIGTTNNLVRANCSTALYK